MTPLTDSEVAYRDLQDALSSMEGALESPVGLRRAFLAFVTHSQTLTDVMRAEFRALTGRSWQAKSFRGWNNVTALFKTLRNANLHGIPIRVDLQQEHRFEISTLFPDAPQRLALGVESTVTISDQPFVPNAPHGLTIERPIPGSTEPEQLPLIGSDNHYILVATSRDTKKALRRVHTADVLLLARECMSVLTEYVAFYKSELSYEREHPRA